MSNCRKIEIHNYASFDNTQVYECYTALDYIYNLGYNGINRVAKLLDISEFI